MTDLKTLELVAAKQDEAAKVDPTTPAGAVAAIAAALANKKQKQADTLVKLAKDAELFHAPDGVGYATFEVAGHRETHALHRKGFRQWLVRQYYVQERGAPGSQALQDALAVLDARARFDGKEIPTFLRVGAADDAIYLDLGDPEWRTVRITGKGWDVVEQAGCRFRRAPGMRPLPIPQRGGTLDVLRSFVNVAQDADFHLFVGAQIAMYSPIGPFPLVDYQGEQGAAKSSAARVMRELVDPSAVALRAMPREERDLHIAATNQWLLVFDNVSRLTAWISDALCRLATGGGFSTRQLYTDQDEVLFDETRPVILTGIEDVVERDDLRDRAIILTLPTIADRQRRDERTFWAEFERVRPSILGCLLDAASRAMRDLNSVRLIDLPRMADFAKWVTAGETAFGWTPGTVATAYMENRGLAVSQFLEGDVFAAAIIQIVESESFKGTAKELLAKANDQVLEKDRGSEWPKTPRKASGLLRRLAPALRKQGFDVVFPGETDKTRTYSVSKNRGANNRPNRPDSPVEAAGTQHFGRLGDVGGLVPPDSAHGDVWEPEA